MYFRNYWLRKTWLDKCLKSPVSEDPLTSNMVNCPKHCWILPWSTFIIFVDHCQENWVTKSLLVMCKIWEPFFNILTEDIKYSPLDRDILTQPVQIQLPKKQKPFLKIFSAVLKSRLSFNHFEKKRWPYSLCISEISDCKRRGLINV